MEKSLSFSTPPSFVTIIVSSSPNEVKYVVHKNLICHYSPFFAAAFTGNFIEGESQTMRMEDVTSEIFGQLNHWLYTQDIESKEDVLVLGHLWILAERCLIPALQNQAMDLIRTTLDTLPATSEKLKGLITLVYDTKQEQHELLRKAIFAKCAFSSSDWLGTLIPHLPQNLLIDVTKALSKHHDGLKNSDKGWANISNSNPNYHVGLPPKPTELGEIQLDSGGNIILARDHLWLDDEDYDLDTDLNSAFLLPLPSPPSLPSPRPSTIPAKIKNQRAPSKAPSKASAKRKYGS